jgi:hypothetical protein
MATVNEKSSAQAPINVSRFLKGIDFPVEKEQLVQQARQNQADREVINLIQRLEDREYDNIADVMKGFDSLQSGQKQAQQPQGRVQSKQAQPHRR